MSTTRSGFNTIVSEPTNRPVIRRFLRAALAVALIPLAVFFLVYYLVSKIDFPTHPLLSPLTLSGLAAVVTVNVVTTVFAALAVYDDLNTRVGITPTSQLSESTLSTEQQLNRLPPASSSSPPGPVDDIGDSSVSRTDRPKTD